MGTGAVFPLTDWPKYKNGDFDFRSRLDLMRILSLDLGLVNDRTVISLMYWDPKREDLWLDKQIVVKGLEEANPINWVNHLMHPMVFGTPIVLPPDAATPGRYTVVRKI
jgi:hypothetical protein